MPRTHFFCAPPTSAPRSEQPELTLQGAGGQARVQWVPGDRWWGREGRRQQQQQHRQQHGDKSWGSRPRPPSPLGPALQVLIPRRASASPAFLPPALNSCPSDHLTLLLDIKITSFPQSVPHLALNSREPTGDWSLGGYIEERLGGYSGGGPGLGEGSG